MVSQIFSDALLSVYHGEQFGEAFFESLLPKAQNEEQRYILGSLLHSGYGTDGPDSHRQAFDQAAFLGQIRSDVRIRRQSRRAVDWSRWLRGSDNGS